MMDGRVWSNDVREEACQGEEEGKMYLFRFPLCIVVTILSVDDGTVICDPLRDLRDRPSKIRRASLTL
jgi:hypothetical protein